MHVFHRVTGRKPSGGGIHIKPSHRGLFTKYARSRGHSVAEEVSATLHSDKASGTRKKEANFARMARRHWKPL